MRELSRNGDTRTITTSRQEKPAKSHGTVLTVDRLRGGGGVIRERHLGDGGRWDDVVLAAFASEQEAELKLRLILQEQNDLREV